MKTINIAGSIKELLIFDDPNNCMVKGKLSDHESKDQWCPYYYGLDCELFREDDGDMVRLVTMGDTAKKCPQCKEAWKAQKEANMLVTKHFNIKPFKISEKEEVIWIERNSGKHEGEGTSLSYDEFDELLEKLFQEVM